jgi:chloramphenicol 3-O-phosphotransferase
VRKSESRKIRLDHLRMKLGITALEEREQLRGNRVIGSARAQYFTVLTGNKYDLEIDTDLMSLETCVTLIIEQLMKME